VVVNTQGAFGYRDLLGMPLDEYFTILEELTILQTANRKEEISAEQQARMARNDPAIPRKRL
jgi:hypothetical protein